MRWLPGVLLGALLCAGVSAGTMSAADGANPSQETTKSSPQGTKPSPEGTKPSHEGMPFDESADARSDIQAALSRATSQNKDVLLEFGANWCPDCRVLAATMADAPLSERIAARYVVVKIDVGYWDRNLDVVKAWGNPIAKGIPSIVVVDPNGSVLYTTKAGELARARRMGASALEKFFATIPQRSL
jgi:thioredoxin 1